MIAARSQIVAYLTALAVVVFTGVVHGLWTQRWADNRDLEAVAARAATLPLVLGDWRGKDQEVDAANVARAEVAGYLFRRYTNDRSGQSVNILLLWGRSGPLSVHTPEVCFGGAGFQALSPPTRTTLQPEGSIAGGQFWTARFEKNSGPLAQYLRAFWAWNAGSAWEAPSYPRLVFRGTPVLFKLYVVRDLARPDEPLDAEPATALLRLLLPQLDAIVTRVGQRGASDVGR